MEAEVQHGEHGRICSSPEKEALLVPHIRQQYNWDCGLACALMVLRAMGVSVVSLQDLHAECKTRSVWTVDVAHLLARHGCKLMFLTVTVGANPDFASETFYKTSMSEDMVRVERLFQDAPQAGIVVEQRSLRWQELRDLLTKGGNVAIVLVDKCKLRDGGQSSLLACCCGLVSPGYMGHYIVVCAYDEAAAKFIVQDPALPNANVRVSAEALDTARLSFGTDEDILIVSRTPQIAQVPRAGVTAAPCATCNYVPRLATLRAM